MEQMTRHAIDDKVWPFEPISVRAARLEHETLRLVPSHAGNRECEGPCATDAQPESRAALRSRLERLEGSVEPKLPLAIRVAYSRRCQRAAAPERPPG